jgi:hypothetical protein
MMHSGFRKNKWGSNEKQTMMIDIFLAQIQVKEAVDILVISICQDVRGRKVEVRGIKFDILVELLGDITVVS